MNPFYGHTLEGQSHEKWELLEDHLQNVAELASQFAVNFDAFQWGELLGRWHDLGKYSLEFQAYLEFENGYEAHLEQYEGRVDHATAGAQHAVNQFDLRGRLLAYCIAGHHGGLPDNDSTDGLTDLTKRLKKSIPAFDAAPADLLSASKPSLPEFSFDHEDQRRCAFQMGLFCRMLFSCLVDADFLATESFMSPEKTVLRPTSSTTLVELNKTLSLYMTKLASSGNKSIVNNCRQEILEACHNAAELDSGLFSLTVPTGGGKTLASLAFALRHAIKHGYERVIFALPFTSIIEQTVQVFREVFSEFDAEIILEHHSNLDPKNETYRSRLAKENWDAPIIVTTNVQFFESLFAAKTSRCRKLHRIVKSIIILDEAQTIPVKYLKPCLAVLQELSLNYSSSIVLCTATQPAINMRDDFPIGLQNVREIVPDTNSLYQKMNRTNVHPIGKLTDDELVSLFREQESFLCIVNTRPHASKLFQKLQEGVNPKEQKSLFHLSTNMCGKHRTIVIKTIKQKLKDGHACKVISTQLIEAGVDIDFPVVYRAMTGLDSIAQAAGRCNREGKREQGDVYLFEPSEYQLRGYLKDVANTTKEIIPDHDDLLSLEALENYFQNHYWKKKNDWDKAEIMGQFTSPANFQFKTVAENFQFIEDASQPIIVLYDDEDNEGKQLKKEVTGDYPPDWKIQRKLQRYMVPVYEHVYQKLLQNNDVMLYHDIYPVLENMTCYDPQFGLRLDRMGIMEPDKFIC